MGATRPLSRVACIVGPTASGKSDVAEAVAEQLESSVVSVDAMQVYRGMDIGTAKVPAAQRRAPLEMVDVADIGEDFSVARFQSLARAACDRLASEGRIPVLCGGSGLYLDAVIDEMEFPAGSIESPERRHYEEFLKEHGSHDLWEKLRSRDPRSASLIHENNARRVIRALELLDEGSSYAERHAGLRQRSAHYEAMIWALMPSRDQLYARIDARVDDMFSRGLVDEVRGLCERGLRDSLTSLQAIGYKEVVAHLDGTCTLDETVSRVKTNTRRYAKRQLSWIRRDGRAMPLDVDSLGVEGCSTRILGAVRDAEWSGPHVTL